MRIRERVSKQRLTESENIDYIHSLLDQNQEGNIALATEATLTLLPKFISIPILELFLYYNVMLF